MLRNSREHVHREEEHVLNNDRTLGQRPLWSLLAVLRRGIGAFNSSPSDVDVEEHEQSA